VRETSGEIARHTDLVLDSKSPPQVTVLIIKTTSWVASLYAKKRLYFSPLVHSVEIFKSQGRGKIK
jgi:hypothetical protein